MSHMGVAGACVRACVRAKPLAESVGLGGRCIVVIVCSSDAPQMECHWCCCRSGAMAHERNWLEESLVPALLSGNDNDASGLDRFHLCLRLGWFVL